MCRTRTTRGTCGHGGGQDRASNEPGNKALGNIDIKVTNDTKICV